MPMSTVEEDEAESSLAKMDIMVRRCSKDAGLGALSAFCVERSRRRRFGGVPGSRLSADVAM